jgi:carbamoyl-phosphate synthase large subunit
MNVLISSAGRRGKLVQLVREDLIESVQDGHVIAVDVSPLSAAAHLADSYELVPLCTAPEFVDAIVDVCVRNDVGLVIPTIDTELPVYALARDYMRSQGITVSVSSPEVIEICANKMSTFHWLVSRGFPTVKSESIEDALSSRNSLIFPLVVKPFAGSSSEGVSVVNSIRELENQNPALPLLVQERANGVEYSADAWVNSVGKCACVVLRRRIEIRAGEISKGVTVKWPEMQELVTNLVDALPGACGALTVQFFATGDDLDSVRFIEINPRYGGGYPLSWQAGARFPLWTIQELLGVDSSVSSNGWRENIVMLRFDEAVFVSAEDVGY